MSTSVSLRMARREDLPTIVEMELDHEISPFVNSDSIDQHTAWFDDETIIHPAIELDTELAGCVLLVLDPDGRSVELRRIVVMPKGKGIGQDSMKLIDGFVCSELKRRSIWLDVLPTNLRAIHVYKKHGYKFIREGGHVGAPLHFYSKAL